ncbi:MAG TPA: nuclease-related domain-containing protein [Syntrophomonadaceae bacterium]|nr:nuclease-related domain-containing protein [Syntrophomonadaceae bacterium]
MFDFIILASPIVVVLAIAIYCIWALKQRKRQKIKTKIKESGNRGEKKVQTTLKNLEKNSKHYKVYHNIKLGPDLEHTNEFDTVIIGPNGIFHIETKNYGGERGGLLDIDSQNNWLLHKKNGYSKMITNPISQVNSHEYRLNGFLYRKLGVRNIPTQGIIVLSCDNLKYRFSEQDTSIKIPILHRRGIIKYIKSYNNGKKVIKPHLIEEIGEQIELMNKEL